ncbi:APC family permease [Brevibacillus choshinensis]|uniref:APC family permease n=1 Tax=Brevibacillus choshinensis TaxID=54911 RepID=UPI002E23B6F4|nr:APC family permease [Brevibacillus choshinensis]MED4784199.1 APC family permease [Brevibacillus choshinensis]
MASQEAKLKKVLGLGDTLGIAVGQIIGAGIMSLTGVAIGMTGTGVVMAFVLSSIFTLFKVMPTAVMGATIPTTGGFYRYSSRLLSPKLGFFWLLLFLVTNLTVALYALSFADYLQSLFPTVPIKPVAFIMLTVFYVTNLVGVKVAAIAEKIMVVILVLSLGLFIAWGVPEVNYSVFNTREMFPGGIGGFLSAVALLSFATGGAQYVAELGGEMKNPGRDIPLTIITTTIGVGILYALMAAVASSVLPVAEVANKPLTDVARTILPGPLFIFFIIGGAMFALATTLNAQLSWATKGILIACEDGWLPKKLGTVSSKFGTPFWILTLFYLIGIIPIVTGLSLKSIASLGSGIGFFANLIPLIAATQMPKKYPELYNKSKFKFKPKNLRVIVVIAVILSLVQGYLLLRNLTAGLLVGVFVYIVCAAIYVMIAGKNQKMKTKETLGFSAEQEQEPPADVKAL